MLNITYIVSAIILCGVLEDAQGRKEAKRCPDATNDRGPVARDETLVEDLFEGLLADSVGNDNVDVPNDQIQRRFSDTAPTITMNTLSPSGNAEVMENVEVGTFVTYISVYDPDSGDNGKVKCETDNNHFKVIMLDDTEHKIVTNKVFDYEEQVTEMLILRCQDQGFQPRTTTKQLVINIKDDNDNAPTITLPPNPSDEVSIRENEEPGTLVTYMSVYDADSGANGRVGCTLSSNFDRLKLVQLYNSEFTLVSNYTFDREARSQYTFEIQCWDEGKVSKTTNKRVKLNIEDVNDNAPTLHRYSNVRISENSTVGTPVVRIYGYDDDIGQNAEIRYALDQSAEGYFKIDPISGVISTDTVLDHMVLNVTAYDGGSPPMKTSVKVNMTITETSNIFTEQSYHFTVQENATAGTTIGKVQVQDKDAGVVFNFGHSYGSRIAFYELFEFDSDTGEIMVKTPLHFGLYDRIVFPVHVSKVGSRRRGAFTVEVIIQDVNDHAPEITVFTLSTHAEAEVSEGAEPGTFIAHVTVSDADRGDNARCNCELDDDNFRLVGVQDGRFKIFTNAVIEHDHMVGIKCTDHGESPFTTTKQLVVRSTAV